MNKYKRRLFFSILLSIISTILFCLLAFSERTISELLCLAAFFLIFIPLAYPLWYFFSFGKFYSGDIDNISKGIFRIKWDYSEVQWEIAILEIWKKHIEEVKHNAIQDIRSFKYWLISVPFLLLSVILFIVGLFDYNGFVLLPITLYFLYIANLKVVRYLLSFFQYLQIKKWLSKKQGSFILGDWGMEIGKVYIPLFGSDFRATKAEIIKNENVNILSIEIVGRKKLRMYAWNSIQNYIIPIFRGHEEKAHGVISYILQQNMGRIA